MSGKINRVSARATIAIAGLVALSACDDTGQFSFANLNGGGVTANAPVAASIEMIERDVEAPEVFQVTDSGLWDGRPSLGGVWVAHPDVIDPERVIIRNQDTGAFVIGALFRRERENPGPALQVSSDAAAALDMLAGAPVTLQVTALRREQAPIETPAATPTFDEVDSVTATTLDGGQAIDPIANAAAAIDAAEATAATTVASTLEKPFIQIGIFSVQDNATRNAQTLRAAGIEPTVLAQSSQGRDFWRVIVGPAQSEAARADLLARIKGLGFPDAYYVTN